MESNVTDQAATVEQDQTKLDDRQLDDRPGVLLIALGTPATLTKKGIRAFLQEFLADRRVVELPAFLWLPILYGPISIFRPTKTLEAYKEVWDQERDLSPLHVITEAQTAAIAGALGDSAHVEWAFTYGNPSIADQIHALQARGCNRIVTIPLYPQYSATTTAAATDRVFKTLEKMRDTPAIRTVRSWYTHPLYIKALAQSVETSLGALDWQPEKIMTSYHGIPKRCYMKGDPYPDESHETTALLIKEMGRPASDFETAFQSRFGAEEWMKPYSINRVKELAEAGVKRLAVMAPAFLADCLETIEELNLELRDEFLKSGGTHFHYIPCLNADEPGMKALEAVVRENLAGWID